MDFISSQFVLIFDIHSKEGYAVALKDKNQQTIIDALEKMKRETDATFEAGLADLRQEFIRKGSNMMV